MTRTIARLSSALLAVGLLAVTAPATAHVGVSTTDAAQGGYGKAVFRVPNESDTATTTRLVVTLPADRPFAFLTAGAKPGWTVKVRKAALPEPTKVGDFELTEAVRTITWTATGDGIGAGQFDEFALSGGPFPEAESIAFSAEQTYSDGKTVAWDEKQSGDEEPEHPAPVLTLGEATADGHDSTAGHDTTDHDRVAADDSDSSATLGTWLGGGALAVALAALVVALRENGRRA